MQADPDLVALHCQEVGGKDFEASMGGVKEFVRYISLFLAIMICVKLVDV